MTLAYWEFLRALEQLSQSMQGVLASCWESDRQSTLWVGEKIQLNRASHSPCRLATVG